MKGNTTKRVLRLIVGILLIVGLICSCAVAGGGGFTYERPDGMLANQATELKATFSSWGDTRGSTLDKRITDATCYYMTPEMLRYKGIVGKVMSADDKEMKMRFVIPPLDLQKVETVKYFFEFMFDGSRNTTATDTMVVK